MNKQHKDLLKPYDKKNQGIAQKGIKRSEAMDPTH